MTQLVVLFQKASEVSVACLLGTNNAVREATAQACPEPKDCH